MEQEKITEDKKTDSVFLTREVFATLGFTAINESIDKDDPHAFLLTSLVAVHTVNTLEKLIFGEEDK
jgi:hypothetical protein